MAHVVTDKCVACKYTDCAAVCPVDDCFIEGPNMLVIDPDVCIDCGVCIPECPAEAIFPDHEDRPDIEFWKETNERLARKWGPDKGITEKKDPLPDHEQYLGMEDKKHLIDEGD